MNKKLEESILKLFLETASKEIDNCENSIVANDLSDFVAENDIAFKDVLTFISRTTATYENPKTKSGNTCSLVSNITYNETNDVISFMVNKVFDVRNYTKYTYDTSRPNGIIKF